MEGKAYASAVSRSQRTVANEICAARVQTAVADVGYKGDVSDRLSQLVEIHAAPDWLWPALVRAMVSGKWTMEHARGAHFKGSARGSARRS